MHDVRRTSPQPCHRKHLVLTGNRTLTSVLRNHRSTHKLITCWARSFPTSDAPCVIASLFVCLFFREPRPVVYLTVNRTRHVKVWFAW